MAWRVSLAHGQTMEKNWKRSGGCEAAAGGHNAPHGADQLRTGKKGMFQKRKGGRPCAQGVIIMAESQKVPTVLAPDFQNSCQRVSPKNSKPCMVISECRRVSISLGRAAGMHLSPWRGDQLLVNPNT
ncbi:hypothetical protein KIL84_021973 [Mauremys mutica]|uniref:Uncharacterized protein n=1 Tax=Mauremys mutica TaxID=74926 RepID=A0A9D3XHY8_9SAUR|nr:hypothetical protein KIL84_021973 [Mauremys mutica]